MPSPGGLQPLAETDLSEDAAETLGRIRDLFGAEPIPEPFLIYAHHPVFLHDFSMNFKRFVLTAGRLDLKSKLLVAFAASVVQAATPWRDFLAARLEVEGATNAELTAAAAIAATCSMYNVLFKFRDMSGGAFASMPVGLRAFTFANSDLDEKIVETINVAVSDLHGCRPCTAGHVAKATSLGVSEEALLEAVQAAAVIEAGAVFLRAS
jgi:alkyl hydroperoxide reductase subunit D